MLESAREIALLVDRALRLAGLPQLAFERGGEPLQQILHNLVGNAIKFTDRGRVAVEATAGDGLVEVAVEDTGVGIPAEKLERIFEWFEQVDASSAREYGGTGLGPTITRQLVELYSGEIWAESEVGEGSRFLFTLPVAAGGEPAAARSDVSRQLARIRARREELVDLEVPPPAGVPAPREPPAGVPAMAAGEEAGGDSAEVAPIAGQETGTVKVLVVA